jgi:hypothetical protein
MKRDQAIAKVSHALPLTVKERGRRGLHPQGAGALWRAYARCDGGICLPPNPKCQQPGAGEHRPVDINALVDESLNLAYHRARAERQGFNITWKGPLTRLPVMSICSHRRLRGRCSI